LIALRSNHFEGDGYQNQNVEEAYSTLEHLYYKTFEHFLEKHNEAFLELACYNESALESKKV
jgi:hypothetical protein